MKARDRNPKFGGVDRNLDPLARQEQSRAQTQRIRALLQSSQIGGSDPSDAPRRFNTFGVALCDDCGSHVVVVGGCRAAAYRSGIRCSQGWQRSGDHVVAVETWWRIRRHVHLPPGGACFGPPCPRDRRLLAVAGRRNARGPIHSRKSRRHSGCLTARVE